MGKAFSFAKTHKAPLKVHSVLTKCLGHYTSKALFGGKTCSCDETHRTEIKPPISFVLFEAGKQQGTRHHVTEPCCKKLTNVIFTVSKGFWLVFNKLNHLP